MRASLFLLALLAVSAFAGDVLFVEPLGSDGIMVKVDVFEAVEKVKAMREATTDEYVERLNRPQPGQLYADATGGQSDQAVVAYSNNVEKGIFQAVGDSIADNPWKWAIGTAAAGFAVYKVGDNYGWWTRNEEGGSSYAIPPIQTGDDSPVIIIINNEQSSTDYSAPVTSEAAAE